MFPVSLEDIGGASLFAGALRLKADNSIVTVKVYMRHKRDLHRITPTAETSERC